MRHGNFRGKLGVTSSHRSSLMKNMAVSLVTHEQIVTTLPKARSLRPYVEKLVTVSKKISSSEAGNSLSYRRRLIRDLGGNSLVAKKLCYVISSRYVDRNGGYLRIVKYKKRLGDSAVLAVIEFVDRDESIKGKDIVSQVEALKLA